MENYLNDLNAPQLEAVLHRDGPLIIIAGAGSGKTKVLTTRIAHLLKEGVSAFNILALTFTNKAASEMKERIKTILNHSDPLNLYIGTFHSVFARILRVEAPQLGYPTNFTIYDPEDAKSLIKTIIQGYNLDDKLYKPNLILNRISDAKNNLISPKAYNENPKFQEEDRMRKKPELGKVYQKYTDECFKNGAMDFDDLLVNMHTLLIKFPAALHKYQHKFKYILIDEYQDTNYLQYCVIKMLADANENICVVGDDAQSIYSFRGATIDNILNFHKNYDQVKTIILDQNYRSHQNILHAANAVIKKNNLQMQKNLWTHNPIGEKIKLIQTQSDSDEGKKIADIIKEQNLRHHIDYKDMAILYRTNAQSRSFEEALRRQNIPYKIYGGISFYQRKEVKDILAYLRILTNHADNEQLKRIINTPTRGIGKTTIEKCLIISAEQNIPFYDIIKTPEAYGFKSATATALANFSTLLQYLTTLMPKQNAYEITEQVCKHSLLLKEYLSDKTVEGIARYQNVQELLNSIKEWTELPDNEDGEFIDKSLSAYLQQIALLTDTDKNNAEDLNSIKLMTVHSAKGLEFKAVFVVGMEEELFPSSQNLNDIKDLEEERRLFYVAITRAKMKLWLSNAQQRYKYGLLSMNDPSRFIDEIPAELIENMVMKNDYNPQYFSKPQDYAKFGFKNKTLNQDLKPKDTDNYKQKDLNFATKEKIQTPNNSVFVNEIGIYKIDQKLMHLKFGNGRISLLEGDINNIIAHIIFDNHPNEVKRIFMKYAKIQILE